MKKGAKRIGKNQISGKTIYGIRWRFFFWIIGLLGSSLNLHAQSDQIKFKTLSSGQGLSNSLAWCIAQDNHGFIWIGTFDGLSLYNGYEFKTYRHHENDSNSISHNYIFDLLFDNKDRLWIGTPKGVDLYDASKDRFVRYSLALKPGASNPDTFWLYEDRQNRIWVGTSNGINVFNEDKQRFEKHSITSELGISSQVTAFLQDETGKYWLATQEGLYVFAPEKNAYERYSHQVNDTTSLSDNNVKTLFEDSKGNIWIGSSGGLNLFNSATNTFKQFKNEQDSLKHANFNAVNCIAEDRNGNLWVGTSEGGLKILNVSSQTFEKFVRDPKNPYSLADNSVKDILVDEIGGVWLATFRGVSYVDQYQMQFDHLEHKAYDPYSLTDNYVTALFKDSQGNIWVGNRYGISKYHPEQNNFTHYKHDPSDSLTIPDGAILNISEDTEGNLWSVTHTGIVSKFDRDKKTFQRFFPNPNDPGSIRPRSNYTHCTEDGNVWIGSIDGISKYNKEDESFTNFSLPDSFGLGQTMTIFEDSKENLWVSSWGGIFLFDRETNTFSLRQELPKKIWPYQTTQIYEDSKSNLWIGTAYNGLIFYNSSDGLFKIYENGQDLPDIHIKGILEDNDGNLWLSSNNGLYRFNPETNAYKEYGLFDGLKNSEYFLRACAKSADGKMFFGGPNGISVFNPEKIIKNPHSPKVIITDFRLFNKTVPIGEDSPLKASITEAEKIVLDYRQTVLSFEFVALSYNSPEKNKYAYRMLGFEEEWNYSGTRRYATYTNLPPGEVYTFQVKASNNDGVWNEEGTSIQLYIRPPFWATWWFHSLLAVFALAGLYGLYRWRTRQLYHQRRKLERKVKERTEEVEAQKEKLAAQTTHLKTANTEIKRKNRKILRQTNELKILDQLKSRFLANISHEFRTPLTLIIVPLEEMFSSPKADAETKGQLSVMRRNARRLLQLINQLLDLSKLENGSIPLELTQMEVVSFVKSIAQSFESLAHKHRINFHFSSTAAEIIASFDADKLEKILYNLLANAFKFTPEEGSIRVSMQSLELTESDKEEEQVKQKKYLQLTVSDNGSGISADHLPHIFDRFYQGESSQARRNNGTGIGLALTKELVELQSGSIKVQSQPGQGTCFSILLPLENEVPALKLLPETALNEPTIKARDSKEETEEENGVELNPTGSEQAPLLLIVEDNTDLRQQIRRIFAQKYRVEEAADGIEGWDKASQLSPDMIISDVMMPGKDGFALCNQLKNDPSTSHIPAILLSARMDGEETGLQIGADDYITKPFNAKALELKVHNLLETRRRFREAICRELGINPIQANSKPEGVKSHDQKFIEQASNITLRHLTDPKFDTELLYRELGMSRTIVYNKLKALTGLGPNEFIRRIRLNKASNLITEGKLSITEVMYAVGYNHRSYFVKCFKNEFGHLPSEHLEHQERPASSTAE